MGESGIHVLFPKSLFLSLSLSLSLSVCVCVGRPSELRKTERNNAHALCLSFRLVKLGNDAGFVGWHTKNGRKEFGDEFSDDALVGDRGHHAVHARGPWWIGS
jgi:hypothetical protein